MAKNTKSKSRSKKPAATPPPTDIPQPPPAPVVPPAVFYINYFDGITDSKVRGLMALFSDVIAKVVPTPTTIYLTLSSPGGSVDAGITLYNFLRALPVDLVIHNIGSVDSIATVVFLAADRRFACAHSRFLFHGVATGFNQGAQVLTPQLQELLSRLVQDERRIKELVIERSNLTETEMLALFKQGETKDPTFALEKGVVHDIRDFALPPGAQIVTANFQ